MKLFIMRPKWFKQKAIMDNTPVEKPRKAALNVVWTRKYFNSQAGS